MRVLSWILLSCVLRIVTALPVNSRAVSSNTTQPADTQAVDFVGFVGDPNGRGTVSLLLNCILTLVLCVWSALHLNVPHQANGSVDTCLCALRWIVAGIYAPELVVFTAWRQWASAKILGSLVNELYTADCTGRKEGTVGIREDGVKPVAPFHLKHNWTRVHDFFACTGGFAFEMGEHRRSKDGGSTVDFLPPNSPSRLTLTARGMALLAECGHLPDLPKEVILDKSKANELAKGMVLIQASWMFLQTIGRLVARLPVTLLEINTVAHVGCVFIMYVLWWDKPLLPSEPIVLEGDWVEPLCAYMYMSSEMSGTLESRKSQTWVKTIFASLNWFSRTAEMELVCLTLPRADPSETEEQSERQTPSCPATIQMAPESCILGLRARRLEKEANTAFFERRPRVGKAEVTGSVHSPTTQRRWSLAQKALETYPSLRQKHVLYQHHNQHKCDCLHFSPMPLVAPNVQNWPSDDLLRNVSGLLVGIMLWLVNFIYGGIHASAWNNHFPTTLEMWMWRASATYIGFCGGLWIILNYSALVFPSLNEFWDRWMDGVSTWFYLAVLGSIVFICGLSFCIARGFILMEAFISVRSLPPAAYDTPDWTQIFPHF